MGNVFANSTRIFVVSASLILTACSPESPERPEVVDVAYCESNLVGAQNSATSARMARQGGAAAVAGGSCGLLLFVTGWFDGGISAGICTVVSAGAVVADSENSARSAQDSFDEYRDSRCAELD